MKNEKVTNSISTNLSFILENEVFATDVENVLEILEVKPITRVPKSPDYIKGVINLRGSVLPVVDLKRIFGLPPVEINEDTCIIVLSVDIDGEQITLGALVDAVSEVLEIATDSIEPAPSIGNKYSADFLQGMWKKDEDFIMLLNVNNVFAQEELSVIRESAENQPDTIEA
jgi:purine-binding chemotaxis protein CheW